MKKTTGYSINHNNMTITLTKAYMEKKKKQQSILEKEIFSIMEKSMEAALDKAVDDLLKDWNKEIKIKL